MTFFSIDLSRAHDDDLVAWAASPVSLFEQVPPPPDETQARAGTEVALRPLIDAQHRANFMIWHLEDQARRRDVADAYIAQLKRSIDPWNQRRNDLMEKIDESVLAALSGADVSRAQLHSETAGMMIDRLSILALKIHNMTRIGTSADDRALAEECQRKAVILREQRGDLIRCLELLVDDFRAGRRFFKRYHQYKAYNDPDLNPALQTTAAGPRSSSR